MSGEALITFIFFFKRLDILLQKASSEMEKSYKNCVTFKLFTVSKINVFTQHTQNTVTKYTVTYTLST